jgi:hypothetical protein
VSACRCERCCPNDPGPTYTRAYLIACLAREIAALPSLTQRRARVEGWEKRHGKSAGAQLKEAVRAVWRDAAKRAAA